MKRILPFILAIVVVISLYFFYVKVLKNVFFKNSNGKFSSDNKTVVTIAGNKISVADVKNEARKQMTAAAITDKALDIFVNVIIEHKILDKEAAKLGINVTDQEISTEAQ